MKSWMHIAFKDCKKWPNKVLPCTGMPLRVRLCLRCQSAVGSAVSGQETDESTTQPSWVGGGGGILQGRGDG